MRGVKLFMKESLPAMIDYIKEVSTPSPEQFKSTSSANADKHDRISVMNALRERKSTMPTLHREALLFLPHLLDIPRHLAVLTSAVVRNSRLQRPRGNSHYSETLWLFTKSCLEVESVALKYVSQLRPRSHGARTQSVTNINTTPQQMFSHVESPQSSPVGLDDDSRRVGKKRLNTRGTRPSTAPSSPETETPWVHAWDNGATNPPLPSSPVDESYAHTTSGLGSMQTHLPLTATNTRRSASPEKNGLLKTSQHDQWSSVRTGDQEGSAGVLDASEDIKKRRRFLPGFLGKR